MMRIKNILITLLSVVLINSAYAYDTANLRVKIAGIGPTNKYFLCVSGVGCVSMFAASKGKIFPIDPGKVGGIFAANITNLRMYPQALPKSCSAPIGKGQTLTVSGQLIKKANDMVYINNLNCNIA